uniref:Uncharacterized protein n=1 Tax=Glossina brevipalpis TaxID=37001 RepID=A0A1A9X176_9MUSC
MIRNEELRPRSSALRLLQFGKNLTITSTSGIPLPIHMVNSGLSQSANKIACKQIRSSVGNIFLVVFDVPDVVAVFLVYHAITLFSMMPPYASMAPCNIDDFFLVRTN